MENIKIDDATKAMLQNLVRRINEANALMKTITTVYLNAKEVKGAYNLSPDCSALIPQEKKE